MYVAYMPTIRNAPCAKLTMRITPKISAMPMPISAYSEPVRRPLSTACRARSVNSMTSPSIHTASREKPPRSAKSRPAVAVARPDQLVLAMLDLRDRHRVGILALGVELDRAERGVELGLAQGVGDRRR